MFCSAALRNDAPGDLCLCRDAAGEQVLAFIVHGENIIKCDFAADFALELFDANGVARGDAILLASTADHCVHTSSKVKAETLIIQMLWRVRQCDRRRYAISSNVR